MSRLRVRPLGFVEDLDLAVAEPQEPLGLQALEDPVHAGASPADQLGEDGL